MSHGYGAEVPAVTKRLFEIRVRGTVPEDVLADGRMRVVAEPAQTVLRGSVRDQAALQGLLSRLHDLGLELIEVRRICSDPEALSGAADPP